MIDCPFKLLTGLDCPGCGLQRAFFALLEGDLVSAFLYYPGLYTLAAAILLTIIYQFHPIDFLIRWSTRLYILSGVIIFLNFALKLFGVIPCPV